MSETSSSDGEPFAAGDDPWTAPLFPVASGAAAAAAGARPRGFGAQAQAPMGAAEDDGWGPGAGGLRVRVVTWNLNEIAPPEEDARLAVGENAEGDADVLVVAAQEGVAPGAWTKALLKATSMYGGECTTKVAVCAVGKISIAVFASERAVAEFVDVKTATVATGIGNVLSNKGGAGVLLTHASGARVAFVGAHLAAHQDEVKARNDSAKRILSKLNFDGATVADADAVVFAGDLNYRVEANRRVVDMLLGDFDTDLALDIMRRNDQLARARGGPCDGARAVRGGLPRLPPDVQVRPEDGAVRHVLQGARSELDGPRPVLPGRPLRVAPPLLRQPPSLPPQRPPPGRRRVPLEPDASAAVTVILCHNRSPGNRRTGLLVRTGDWGRVRPPLSFRGPPSG